jgi:hypothetical protein
MEVYSFSMLYDKARLTSLMFNVKFVIEIVPKG